MCIRWCCKNCPDKLTKLTHRWAYERCNEYFIARSKDEHTTECPNGPWELVRAYHRHPYRGLQSCDDCKRAGRKDKKLGQSARHKAKLALGQRPEYTGAIYLGELEIPETFHRNEHPVLQPGKLNAMKSKWESFSTANGHLPSHELEHLWTTSFAAFSDVGLDDGVRLPPMNITSTFGQGVSGEDGNRVISTLVETIPQDIQQQNRHHSTSNTHDRNETHSRGQHLFVQYNPNSTVKRSRSTTIRQEASGATNNCTQYNYTNNISPDADKRNTATVEETSTATAHHQQPFHDSIRAGVSDGSDRPIITAKKEGPLDSDRSEFNDSCVSTTHNSSSQPTRTRPWDL